MYCKKFNQMACPDARTLERVGEWWTILILRDAFAGTTRFDAFQKRLGVAPNIQSRRRAALVEAGMLERHGYSTRPPRDEDRLTPRGRDFQTVLTALLSFGNRHFAPQGEPVLPLDANTGEPADPILADRRTGRLLVGPDYKRAPNPAATEATNARLTPRNARPPTTHIAKDCRA